MLRSIRVWHRRLSLLAGVALLLWAGSGLLHPLMNWTGPRPAAFAPPSVRLPPADAGMLRAALERQGITQVQSLRQMVFEGQSYWQVQAAGETIEPLYLSTVDGEPVPGVDRRHAEHLARHYTGETQAAVVLAMPVTQFSRDYPAVNRLLPVWEIRFDRADGLTAYVETASDRMATLSTVRKRRLLAAFQALHTLDWMQGAEGLRLALITTLIAAALVMAVLGLGLMLWSPRAAAGAQRWRRGHRLLGVVVWGPVLMFSVSGLLHLWVRSPVLEPPALPMTGPAVHQLQSAPMPAARDQFSLVPLADGSAWWRERAGEQVSYWHARNGERLDGDEALRVRELAAARAGLAAADWQGVEPLHRFTDEYGFANKRLPVWRLQAPDGERWFVEAATGRIAARVAPLAVLEGRSFSLLHKWQFLDPLGRALRDGLMVLIALLIVGLSAIGLRLRFRADRS